MSFVSRLWNSLRNPVRYVGRDLHGNKFYEAPSPNDPSRPKRTVEYHEPEDMWKYIGGGKRLAIQWSSWLTHTRPNPPTIEELQADMLRQQRVSANVALIEVRDRAESEEMLRIRQHDAARALEEAATRNDAVPLVPEPATAPSATADTTLHTTTAAQHQQQQQQAAPLISAAPTARATSNVLPPKFVTPATPRKSRGPAEFALPSSVNEEKAAGAELQPEQSREAKFEAKRKEEAAGVNPPPPMPSRPTSDTESWTPKARRRG